MRLQPLVQYPCTESLLDLPHEIVKGALDNSGQLWQRHVQDELLQ